MMKRAQEQQQQQQRERDRENPESATARTHISPRMHGEVRTNNEEWEQKGKRRRRSEQCMLVNKPYSSLLACIASY